MSEAKLLLRFGVVSDLHCTDNPEDRTNKYLGQAFDFLKAQAGGHLDCIAIPGDVTQWGRQPQLEMFNKILVEHIDAKETPVINCSGNHDQRDDTGLPPFEERMEALLDQANYKYDLFRNGPKGSRHAVLNHVHFICVNASNYVVPNKPYLPEVVEWFEQELCRAEKEDPGMPIIVLSHMSVTNTVCGSKFNAGFYLNLMWHDQQLRPVLEKHPQIVYISGHLHYSAKGEDSIMQDGFTAINCPPVSYLVTDFGFYQYNKGLYAIPEDAYNHPGGFIVEVFDNGETVVHRYDIGLGCEVRKPWVIPNPVTSGKTPYSLHRRNIAPADFPVKDLEATAVATTEGKVNLSLDFSAATSDTDIFFYEVELIKDRAVYDIRKYMTDYYRYAQIEDCPKQVHIDCGEVETGKEFAIAVTPYDIWRNPGVTQRIVL